MSDEERPVRPAVPHEPTPAPKATEAPASAKPAPAFSEVDALLDTEKPIGPAPDHASAYVPPRELPKETRHKTIEDLRVRIRQEADSRRAKTQKLPPRPVEAKDTVRLNRPRRPPPPVRQTAALAWLISASVIVVAFMVAGVVIYRMRMADPDPKAAPVPAAPVAATTITPLVEVPVATAAPPPATASVSARPPEPVALPPSPKPRAGSRK